MNIQGSDLCVERARGRGRSSGKLLLDEGHVNHDLALKALENAAVSMDGASSDEGVRGRLEVDCCCARREGDG